jgi:hypothetical protein
MKHNLTPQTSLSAIIGTIPFDIAAASLIALILSNKGKIYPYSQEATHKAYGYYQLYFSHFVVNGTKRQKGVANDMLIQILEVRNLINKL